MATAQQRAFGTLLKRYREARNWTQEDLAERAKLSVRRVQGLEKGEGHVPRRDTVTLLADALGLTGEQRTAFEAAARPLDRSPTTPLLGPAAHSPSLPPGLPPTVTPLVGREHDEARVTHLLSRVRLLTLTGPGGVGKTRLALQVAATQQGRWADGARVVALDSVRDPTFVLTALAQALDVREEGGQPLRERVIAALQPREQLLLLDNFEQVTAAAFLLLDLLVTCERLTLLVTSRVALDVGGEHVYAVEPLAVPRKDEPLPSLVDLAGFGAVRLLVRRVRAHNSNFELTAKNAAAVAGICRRLDGLPLALELAARRLRLTTPEALLQRLEQPLPELERGSRDLPDRQRTMRNTIAWSYQLLQPAEQALFRRLSVCVGGGTIEAIAALCTALGGVGLNVEAGLEELARHSLVSAKKGSGGAIRVRMLETLREYGREQLAIHGEDRALRTAHALYYLALAQEAEPHLQGPEQAAWLARLEAEHDNLQAALHWALESSASMLGLRLADALTRFWDVRGHLSEGRAWLQKLLDAAGPLDTSAEALAIRADALYTAGRLAWRQGDLEQAWACAGESLTLHREQHDAGGIANALNLLGTLASMRGDYAHATDLYEESLELKRQLADRPGAVYLLNNLGNVAYAQRNYTHAAHLYEQCLALGRELGDKHGIALAQLNLGNVAYAQAHYIRATELYEGCLALRQELGDKRGIAASLNNLGNVALELGNHAGATTLYRESLDLYQGLGDREGMVNCLEGMARLAHGQGDTPEMRARAARLLAAVAALRGVIGARLPPSEQPRYDQAVAAVRAALGDEVFAAAWVEGQAMTLEQTISQALDEPHPV